MPDIQENTFIYSFTVVIGYCSIRKLIVVAPNAVFRGEEEGSIHIGGIRKQEVKLTSHVITFAMINSDS